MRFLFSPLSVLTACPPSSSVLLLCQRLHILQLSRMLVLLLMVLQVRLSCILRNVEEAEVVLVAGRCVALSLVPAMVCSHPLIT